MSHVTVAALAALCVPAAAVVERSETTSALSIPTAEPGVNTIDPEETECHIDFEPGYRLLLTRSAHDAGLQPMLLVKINVRHRIDRWLAHCWDYETSCPTRSYPDIPRPWAWLKYSQFSAKPRFVRLFPGPQGGTEFQGAIYFIEDRDPAPGSLDFTYVRRADETEAYKLAWELERLRWRVGDRWWAFDYQPWMHDVDGRFRLVLFEYRRRWVDEQFFRAGDDNGRVERVVEWHRLDMDALVVGEERLRLCASRHLIG